MDRALYTAMGAASAVLDQQAVVSNNMANASTPGFRAQLSTFRAVPVEGQTIPTRTMVASSTPGNDFSMGPVEHTGRDLDVALQQDGWLAVQLPDGGEGYTRNGNIEVDSEGQLRVGGLPLMGDGGPIAVPPQSQITIAPDGTVSALGAGDEAKAIAQVGRLKMVRASGNELQHGDDGLFHAQDQQDALPNDPTLRLIPGAIEGSNVSPVKAMVSMIGNARQFEMQMKVVSNVSDNAQRANQLLGPA